MAARIAPWLLVATLAFAAPFNLRMVRGGSMAPSLLPGDVCLIWQNSRVIRRGDVVLFRKDGWPGGVLHRVTEVLRGGRFETQGDANPVSDLEPVRQADVLGRCVLVVPTGRAAYFLGDLVWW